MEFLSWLEASRVGLWVSESEWGYPIILTGHAVGMVCVVGVVLAFDLRVLGYAKQIPLSWFRVLRAPASIGVALSVISGALLFSAAATKFIGEIAFQLKIVLIIAGSVCTWWLMRRYRDDVSAAHDLGTGNGASIQERCMSALSMLFWLGAILAGRLIAYT